MNYNPDMDAVLQRLLWDVMDIKESKHITVKALCDMADITYGNYKVLFWRNAKKHSGFKALLSVIDALGYKLVLRRKDEGNG